MSTDMLRRLTNRRFIIIIIIYPISNSCRRTQNSSDTLALLESTQGFHDVLYNVNPWNSGSNCDLTVI